MTDRLAQRRADGLLDQALAPGRAVARQNEGEGDDDQRAERQQDQRGMPADQDYLLPLLLQYLHHKG
jgi:hypothetical protein